MKNCPAMTRIIMLAISRFMLQVICTRLQQQMRRGIESRLQSSIGVNVQVMFQGSFYWVSSETIRVEYMVYLQCPFPVMCSEYIPIPAIANTLSSRCHSSSLRYRSRSSTQHRWYIADVDIAINVMIAQNQRPFLRHSETMEGTPKRLLVMTIRAIRVVSIGVRPPQWTMYIMGMGWGWV